MANERGEMELELLPSPFPTELSSFDLSGGFEDPIPKALSLFVLTQNSLLEQPFPWECLLKTIGGKLLNILAA